MSNEIAENFQGELTTVWQLLDKYEVIIPLIPRDYAQGREDIEATTIREQFLDDLHTAINQPDGKIVLDYIYGSIKNSSCEFHPIDGQQRLTTLWLLHRYFSWKENIIDIGKKLEKFSYQVRDTAREFCKALANNNISLCDIEYTLSGEIKKKSWFHLSYQSDPTVKAMLKMLDGIHQYVKQFIEHITLKYPAVSRRKML